MDLKDKIVALALAALIALVGWNLKETWGMKEEVFKLKQGQIYLSAQMESNNKTLKRNINNIKKRNKRKKKND
jgi:hypothetical protein|tara:strand:- start:138 stop:356 length:219 start_codon:yes stop_codon:yes gene_type:complete